MNRKRIVIFNIVSYQNIPGGAQQSIEECINNLQQDNEIIFVYFKISKLNNLDKSTFHFYGNKNKRYEINFSRNNLLKLPFIISKISFLLFKFKPDLLWAHHPLPYIFFKPIFPFVKSIYSFHGPFLKELKLNKQSFFKQIFYYFLFIISSLISSVHYDTKYTRNAVQKELPFLKNSSRNIFTGPALINPFLYTRDLNNFFVDYKKNISEEYILIPRRLEPRTGVYQFLKMINQPISRKEIIYKFLITGSGKDYNLISQFRSAFFDYEITGFLPYLSMLHLLFNSRYVLIPSLDAEGYCLPARIAYILGKPIVTTGIGGIPEAYPEDKGFFCFKDIDSFFVSHQKALKFKLNDQEILIRQSKVKTEFSSNLKRILYL